MQPIIPLTSQTAHCYLPPTTPAAAFVDLALGCLLSVCADLGVHTSVGSRMNSSLDSSGFQSSQATPSTTSAVSEAVSSMQLNLGMMPLGSKQAGGLSSAGSATLTSPPTAEGRAPAAVPGSRSSSSQYGARPLPAQQYGSSVAQPAASGSVTATFKPPLPNMQVHQAEGTGLCVSDSLHTPFVRLLCSLLLS